MNELYVFDHEQNLIGTLLQDEEERLGFSYSEDWIKKGEAYALSFALPLAKEPFGHLATRSYFENLLPEGDIRASIEKATQISTKSEFDFLKNFGQDCAGALIISADKKLAIRERQPIKLSSIDKAIEEKVSLPVYYSSEEGAHFSLAGAQDKLAVIYDNNELFLPGSDTPSTHILKTPVYNQEAWDSVYNEYFCMKLASRCGLDVPEVKVIKGKNPLYLVKRFDRERIGKNFIRLHQQDFCQALGLTSQKKYEAQGGPNLVACYGLIQDYSADVFTDIQKFLNWFLFNFVLGNNDTHGKNVSFLLSNGKWHLSPCYDLLCTAVYKFVTKQYAFSIGDQRDITKLKKVHFEIQEKALGLKQGTLSKELEKMTELVWVQSEIAENEFSKEFENIYTAKKIREAIEARRNTILQRILK